MDVRLTIQVLEDIEETSDGIKKLLKVDIYRVKAARDEQDASGKLPVKAARPDSDKSKPLLLTRECNPFVSPSTRREIEFLSLIPNIDEK